MSKKTCLSITGVAAFMLCAAAAHADPAPDNTAVNARDRAGQTLTADNQSQSKSDVELAAAIRRSILAQSGLSVAGQNVKVITKDGAVTLRGPVKDDAEKARIETAVHHAAGSSPVDNKLEVAKSESK